MTEAEGQMLFRFADDVAQQNQALRAEVTWLRANMRQKAMVMQLLAREMLRLSEAQANAPQLH